MTVTVAAALVMAAAAVLVWPAPRAPLLPAGPADPDGQADPADPADPAKGAGTATRAATVEEAAAALALVAAALRSGVGSLEALEAVARVAHGPAGRELAIVAAAHRWGEAPEAAWARVGPGWGAAAVSWHAAHTAGAAPAGLLAAAATRMQEEESRRMEAALHRAGVLLVLPLGVCFLPGFVATTVVPVVLLLLGGLLT